MILEAKEVGANAVINIKLKPIVITPESKHVEFILMVTAVILMGAVIGNMNKQSNTLSKVAVTLNDI